MLRTDGRQRCSLGLKVGECVQKKVDGQDVANEEIDAPESLKAVVHVGSCLPVGLRIQWSGSAETAMHRLTFR